MRKLWFFLVLVCFAVTPAFVWAAAQEAPAEELDAAELGLIGALVDNHEKFTEFATAFKQTLLTHASVKKIKKGHVQYKIQANGVAGDVFVGDVLMTIDRYDGPDPEQNDFDYQVKLLIKE